jgi:hypothetical protein
MSVNFFDGMAGIFQDIFSPVDEETGELELFEFRTASGDSVAFAPAIYNEQYSETLPAKPGQSINVVATWPSLVVSLEDHPIIAAVQRDWQVILPDGEMLVVSSHIDVLRGKLRRFRLKKAA